MIEVSDRVLLWVLNLITGGVVGYMALQIRLLRSELVSTKACNAIHSSLVESLHKTDLVLQSVVDRLLVINTNLEKLEGRVKELEDG